MNYVEYLELFGVSTKEIPCTKGKGAPTASTEGAVGLLYMDTDNGSLYKCTAALNGVYTWEGICSKEIGDIEAALEELHAYAQALIGGDSA